MLPLGLLAGGLVGKRRSRCLCKTDTGVVRFGGLAVCGPCSLLSIGGCSWRRANRQLRRARLGRGRARQVAPVCLVDGEKGIKKGCRGCLYCADGVVVLSIFGVGGRVLSSCFGAAPSLRFSLCFPAGSPGMASRLILLTLPERAPSLDDSPRRCEMSSRSSSSDSPWGLREWCGGGIQFLSHSTQ